MSLAVGHHGGARLLSRYVKTANSYSKKLITLFILNNSTFANGEVKEFKEVREVKAICFIAKYTTKRLLVITSNDRRE